MKSKALEINLESYRVDVSVEDKYAILQEVMSKYYGLREGLNTFLKELSHPYKNWEFIVQEARNYSLNYFHLRKGKYRARAVKRIYIPKGNGRQRPIGIPALEDKIVQRAMVEVLDAIYEVDFLGFSYGFRPKRNQHNALDEVVEAIEGRKVNWVLDLDIRGFFDAIDHEWLLKFVEHRIKDKRVIRHIMKWLKAGIYAFSFRTERSIQEVQS